MASTKNQKEIRLPPEGPVLLARLLGFNSFEIYVELVLKTPFLFGEGAIDDVCYKGLDYFRIHFNLVWDPLNGAALFPHYRRYRILA